MFERLKITILCLSTLIVAYGLIGGLMERVSAGDEAYRDLSMFTRVLDRVRSDYVEAPDMEKALRGALHGMMEALDSYSSFIEAGIFEKMREEDGNSGYGLTVSKRYGYVYVVAVDPGSPAHSAGLRTGDLFESIDSQPTTLISLWEAQRLLSGSGGNEVLVRVIRSRHGKPLEITLIPSEWEGPAMAVRVIEGNLGLIHIPSIDSGTAEAVNLKIKLLLTDPPEGLLIDLRRCTRGEVEDGSALADLFLAKGQKIVTEKSKSGSQVERVSLAEPVVDSLPIVLLVNSGTSGAAEVFVSALKDNGIAEIVGERTNGKGSIQTMHYLEDGSVLILTTRHLIRPSGDPLQADEIRNSGVKPDVQAPSRDFVTDFYFENSPEDDGGELGQEFYLSLDEAIDSKQLEKTIQHLKELISGQGKSRKVA